MPIKAQNRSKYPRDWKVISARIRFVRAEGRCECSGQCGLHHKRRCAEKHGSKARWAKGVVVLTVAHYPDPDPSHVADDNLIAACQRCHLRMDHKLHMKNARETRRSRKAIGELF